MIIPEYKQITLEIDIDKGLLHEINLIDRSLAANKKIKEKFTKTYKLVFLKIRSNEIN